MAMVCPQCNGVYDRHLECPTCGVRLFYDANPQRAEGQWQQTPWGRMFVGLLLAQGLAHGLRLALRATMQVSEEADDAAIWSTVSGTLLLQSLQGLGLLLGGMVCGAGQQRGVLYGSFIGLVNGLIFLFMQLGGGHPLSEIAVYTQPILHVAFGAAGALLGALIWKPIPVVKFQPLTEVATRVHVRASGPAFWSGPIAWVRIVTGAVLILAGVFWSKQILGFLLEASEGKLEIGTRLQGRLVIWEIWAVAVMLGAGLAGATTTNGAKQGLLTGIAASLAGLAIYLGNPQITLDLTFYVLATLLALSLVGGWFGGQLFPPVAANSRRRRRVSAA